MLEVRHYKHTEECPASDASINRYTGAPSELIILDITKDTMAEVGHRISGGAGTGRTGAVILQNWILFYGEASDELR